MDYNGVALFVQVVKTGSFTAAGAAVGLPKSSVSRGIARLEKDLGVRLIQRTTRKLALTEVGQSYYGAVSESMAAMEQADAAARERGPAPTGTVRITAPAELAGLAPALAEFTRLHPGIRVELMLTSRVVDLVTEGVDFALRVGRLPDSSLIARRIGTAQAALMAAPAYLRRRGQPKAVAELAAHDWILYRAVGGRATLTLRNDHGQGPMEETAEVRATIVADSMDFCRVAAEAGGGIALLPFEVGQEALVAGRLVLVLPGWVGGEASLYAVLPTGRFVPARVALVRDFLVERLGNQLETVASYCQKAREAKKATQATQEQKARRPRLSGSRRGNSPLS